jgi:plasmid stabilization system protein ParE
VKTTVLSPSVRLDLLEIDLHTFELFGYDQSVTSADEFRRVFRMLAENPELGQIREDVSPAGRSFRIWTVLRRFVVVYEYSAEALRIVRIVDGSRDLPAVLTEE